MEKKVIGRRDFMKSTLAGFGGFYFLTLNEPKQEEKPFDIKGKEKKLVYRTLGRTGLNLPVINMGVMNSDNPDLMRAYMYVYDYRNLGMAQDLVVSLGLPAELCGDCSRCPVRCPSG
ncbi:MAG: hypothetical protein L6300_04565, partial [Syntrophaceae bacterium]|nr:hypothetical protein [Syntrophaceae bacterium]